MIERWTALARTRPWIGPILGLALLACAAVIAAGAPRDLAVGSLALGGQAQGAAPITVELRAGQAEDPELVAVALEVVTAQLESHSGIEAVEQRVAGDGSVVLVATPFARSGREQTKLVSELRAGIDAGTLSVRIGGEAAALDDARRAAGRDLWWLELLALPFAALVLFLTLGVRNGLAAAGAAALAVAGAGAALRLAGAELGVSLLALAVVAPVGISLAVELARALAESHRAAEALGAGRESLRLAWSQWARPAAFGLSGAALAPAAILATPLAQGPSLVAGCALAGLAALAGVTLFAPGALATGPLPARHRAGRVAGRVRGRAGALALGALIAAATALAAPALAADAQGFAAPEQAGSLIAELPAAAVLAAVLACLVPAVVLRSFGLIALGALSLLPAAAALGLLSALASADLPLGRLASPSGTLESGALAAALCALVAVSAARSSMACAFAWEEHCGVRSAQDAARAVARATLGPAAVGTAVVGVGAAALLGAELYAVREFGFLIAAGLLIELIVVRPVAPLLALRLIRRRAPAPAV